MLFVLHKKPRDYLMNDKSTKAHQRNSCLRNSLLGQARQVIQNKAINSISKQRLFQTSPHVRLSQQSHHRQHYGVTGNVGTS
jgi:hypothetical protein